MDRKDKLLQMLADSPGDSFLQHALALEYIKEGKDEDAETLFMKILDREPGYTGSYYHLGKLLERNGRTDDALEWYKKGMTAARVAGDRKTYNELQSAYEELSDD
ncbi:MAG: tetratricopeptide repeat protein [Chitinophagaceae bacterium]|nr:tetratricopeptide repeat protein [Chitinophagaceae bacterium]MCW5928872.1 tetratricopeptide repeat protein [Chitinophagaceae bacterium]